MLTASRLEHPVLRVENWTLSARCRALHAVRFRCEIVAKRSRRISWIFSQTADAQLHGRTGWIAHRRDQVDQSVGSRRPKRLAVGPVGRYPVDEHHPQV